MESVSQRSGVFAVGEAGAVQGTRCPRSASDGTPPVGWLALFSLCIQVAATMLCFITFLNSVRPFLGTNGELGEPSSGRGKENSAVPAASQTRLGTGVGKGATSFRGSNFPSC